MRIRKGFHLHFCSKLLATTPSGGSIRMFKSLNVMAMSAIAGFLVLGCSGNHSESNGYFAPLQLSGSSAGAASNGNGSVSGKPSGLPSGSPSGVASPSPSPSPSLTVSTTAPLPCLSGSASVVGFSDTQMSFTMNAAVRGSVVLFGNSSLSLSENAKVVNDVYTQNPSNVTENMLASVGGILPLTSAQNEAAVLAFTQSAALLAPTQSFDSITISGMNDSSTINGNGASNVIQVKNGVSLSFNENLILQGSVNDSFVFLIESGGINLSLNAAITLSGGVLPQNVLFLIEGKNPVNLGGNGSVSGTFMAPESSVGVSGNGHIQGSIFGMGNIMITGNGLSFDGDPWCPVAMAPTNPSVPITIPGAGGGILGI